jgi:phenylpropionate dioxygenase-like ring-hydroxylating dioxygenase large terminal subunit
MERGWARSIVDADAFHHEQKCLAGVWTFLGLSVDIPDDGDWFTTTLATRSVFVQRFGAELRGFENICLHRGYPMRVGDRGNGPVLCGYHHWLYDKEGRLVGVPLARDLYDALPREMGIQLGRIELAVCGTLIFGRFPAPGTGQTLEQFLDDGFPILQAATQVTRRPQRLTAMVEANWHFCMHITLDGYHAVAVHPRTVGRHGYIKRGDVGYFRFGLHSSLLNTPRPNAFETMQAGCRKGTFRPTHYSILQVVPNVLLVMFSTDWRSWHCFVQVFDPLRHDRSRMRVWLYPAPFAGPRAWLRKLTDPVRKRLVGRALDRIFSEDNAICEQQQKVAPQMDFPPRLGTLEERIDWFESSCAALVAAGEASG